MVVSEEESQELIASEKEGPPLSGGGCLLSWQETHALL